MICQAEWQLVWSDEFNQADGSSPDSANWGFDIGGGGWGNNQQEYDTSRTNNARIEGGNLVIEAHEETYTGADNVTRDYTSARMLTKDKWSWTYGRIEGRLKIPRGQGIWPAFWTLGDSVGSIGWPNCGEIDIMENIGKVSDQGTVHGTIHGPGYSGGGGIGGSYTLPGGVVLADDFHLYAIEWTTNQIKWFLDDHLFFTATPASLPGGSTWVFTNSHFVILNIAVGGYWPGYPDATTVFPQQMLVDYVRVYKFVPAPPSAVSVAIQQGQQVSWPTATGATWILQSSADGVTWSNVLGPTPGSGATNTYFDPAWSAQNTQYQVLEMTNGAGNIIANPGFETGTGPVAGAWTITGSQPPIRISTNAHTGTYSMRLFVTNSASTANASEMDEDVAAAGGLPVIPGKTYTLSFWAKQISSGVSYVQNYGITWRNSSGGTVGSVGLSGFTAGNGVWSKFTVNNLVAPANAVNALLKIYAATGSVSHGYGGVLIDDVALSFTTGSETNVIAAAVQPAVQLSWPSSSEGLYDVQQTDDWGGNNWSNLASSIAGNGATNTVSDTLGQSACRYYRVLSK